jgi:hypothetical protein
MVDDVLGAFGRIDVLDKDTVDLGYRLVVARVG